MKKSSFLLGLMLMSSTVPAQTLYVDDDAIGSGTGTQLDPFSDISLALADPSCVAGSTVVVLPGEYSPFSVSVSDVTIVGEAGPNQTIVNVAMPGETGVSVGTLSGPVRGLWFRGAPAINQQTGAFVSLGARGVFERCVFTDFDRALVNGWDLYVNTSAVMGCNVAYEAAGQDISGVLNTIFWDNDVFAQGSLTGQPTVTECFFGDPLHFAEDDFHLRRVSACIDVSTVLTDPDGSAGDIGPYPYDWNHPLGDSYCFNEPNSTGERSRVQVLGTTSLSGLAAGEDLRLRAVRCPADQVGVFVIGDGTGEIPLSTGESLCVGNPLQRLGPVALTGIGEGHATWMTSASVAGLNPGDRRSAQFWHRDATPGGTGLSHAVAIELQP